MPNQNQIYREEEEAAEYMEGKGEEREYQGDTWEVTSPHLSPPLPTSHRESVCLFTGKERKVFGKERRREGTPTSIETL